jgi:hypothetical protein
MARYITGAARVLESLTENFDLGTKEGQLTFGVMTLAAEKAISPSSGLSHCRC